MKLGREVLESGLNSAFKGTEQPSCDDYILIIPYKDNYANL